MKFQDLLHGHPNGINKLSIGPSGVRLIIQSHGASEAPIKVKQISGGVGDVEQEVKIGHYESTVEVDLFNGAGINLCSQGGEMLITHVKS